MTRVEPSTERYDELLELCKSSFEKNVLEAMRRRKLRLPTDAQKTIYNGDESVAQADFYYDNDRLIVFVDGPDHGKDYVNESDKEKRERLDGLGYRVFVVRYDENLDERLDSLAKYLGM